MTRKKTTKKQPSFEKLMERLEGIAGELESGELGLEKAIECYEEGVKCYKQCHGILSSAEKKVEILTRSAEGRLEAEPFEEALEESEDAAEDKTSGAEDDEEESDEGRSLF